MMDVSSATLLKKIREELKRIEQTSSTEAASASFSHIKVLSELWLEEYKQRDTKTRKKVSAHPSVSTNDNMDVTQKASKEQQILASAQHEINEEEDDFSIFDF